MHTTIILKLRLMFGWLIKFHPFVRQRRLSIELASTTCRFLAVLYVCRNMHEMVTRTLGFISTKCLPISEQVPVL